MALIHNYLYVRPVRFTPMPKAHLNNTFLCVGVAMYVALVQVPSGQLQQPCPNPARYFLSEGRYSFSLQATDNAGLHSQVRANCCAYESCRHRPFYCLWLPLRLPLPDVSSVACCRCGQWSWGYDSATRHASLLDSMRRCTACTCVVGRVRRSCSVCCLFCFPSSYCCAQTAPLAHSPLTRICHVSQADFTVVMDVTPPVVKVTSPVTAANVALPSQVCVPCRMLYMPQPQCRADCCQSTRGQSLPCVYGLMHHDWHKPPAGDNRHSHPHRLALPCRQHLHRNHPQPP